MEQICETKLWNLISDSTSQGSQYHSLESTFSPTLMH